MENEVQPVTPLTQPTVQAPIPVQPTLKKSNFLKTFFIVICLILFGVLIGVLASRFLPISKTTDTQKIVEEPMATPTTTPTTDPTIDWKTYQNIALGFELKYPPTANVDKEMNDQYNRATIFKGEDLNFEVMLRKTGGTTLDKYFYMDNPNFSKATLDGKDANVYIYDAGNNSCINDGSGPSCPLSYVTYVVLNGADLYHLSFFGDSTLSDNEKAILSSFKLNPTVDPTTNWETYTNSTYNFSIKYPKGWISKNIDPPSTGIPYLFNPINEYSISFNYFKDRPNEISEMTGKPVVEDLTGYTPTTINGIQVYINTHLQGVEGYYMKYLFQIEKGEYLYITAQLTNFEKTWDDATISLAKQIISTFKFTR